MKIIGIIQRLAFSATLVSGLASAAFADGGDSSADAGSFTEVVKAAKGVIIQVPINEQGQELAGQADIRVYGGDKAVESNTDAIATAFRLATSATNVPEITRADVERDSSTSWGWYGGYRGGYGQGWGTGYYYYNYRPSYYSSGSYYSYGSPYYYNNYYGYSYGGQSYYGSRYYYYPYYWN